MFEVSFYLVAVGMMILGVYGIYEIITGGRELNEKVEHEAEVEKRERNMDMYI